MSKPELKIVKEPSTASSLGERAKQKAHEVEERQSKLNELSSQDAEINGAIEALMDLKGKAKHEAVKEIRDDFNEAVINRLSILFMDKDLRGEYLTDKNSEIKRLIQQIQNLEPGSDNRSKLHSLVNVAIAKGFLEGAWLAHNGEPDIANVKFPQLKNKKTGDLCVKLRGIIVEKEKESINSAIQTVKATKSFNELNRLIKLFGSFGWIETPLPRNKKMNIQYQNLQAPRVCKDMQNSVYALLRIVQKQPNKIAGRKK
jgi:ribonuclease HI